MFLRSILVALALLVGATFAQEDEVVCFQGYVMDTYCVRLGVLLDNPTVETLRHPELHSFHCLVDVPRCIADGYEMLAESPGREFPYGRFLRLDATGNEQMLELARSFGQPGGCSTCTGTLGSETQGFRATVIGTLVSDSGYPQTFATQSVVSYEQGCPEGMTVIEPNADDLSFDAGGAQSKVLTHGSLMLIGWGFLLPLGIITAVFLRHRPNGLWFKMHRTFQLVGLLFALVGWAIALKNFNVLGSGGGGTSALEKKAYAHAVCGTTAMCIGLLQPLNAIFRPHPPADGEKKPTNRLLWELVHKSVGYIGAILALVSIGLGTRIASSYENQFLAGFVVSLVFLAAIAFIMIVDNIRYKKRQGFKKPEGPNEQKSLHEPEVDAEQS